LQFIFVAQSNLARSIKKYKQERPSLLKAAMVTLNILTIVRNPLIGSRRCF
jgi:hypothetical protein